MLAVRSKHWASLLALRASFAKAGAMHAATGINRGGKTGTGRGDTSGGLQVEDWASPPDLRSLQAGLERSWHRAC